MREGLIELPEDVIILEQKFTNDGIVLQELPLSVIPDSEAAQIRHGIEFVKKAQDGGATSPEASYGYDVEGKHWQMVHYKIVLKNSWSTRTLQSF